MVTTLLSSGSSRYSSGSVLLLLLLHLLFSDPLIFVFKLLVWLVLGTGLAAVFINLSVENFAGWKFALTFAIIQKSYFAGFIVYLVINLVLVFSSAYIITQFAPAAAGSGIPEIKGYLNGTSTLPTSPFVSFFLLRVCKFTVIFMHLIVQELIFLVPCSLEPLSERCVFFVWNVVLILKVHFFFLLPILEKLFKSCSCIDIWKHWFCWRWFSLGERRSPCTYRCLHCIFAWSGELLSFLLFWHGVLFLPLFSSIPLETYIMLSFCLCCFRVDLRNTI